MIAKLIELLSAVFLVLAAICFGAGLFGASICMVLAFGRLVDGPTLFPIWSTMLAVLFSGIPLGIIGVLFLGVLEVLED